MMRLTTIPISIFQMTESANVRDIIAMSVQAPILMLAISTPKLQRQFVIPPVVHYVVGDFAEQCYHKETDAKYKSVSQTLEIKGTYIDAKTHLGKKYRYGRRKKVASNVILAVTIEANCVRAPTSPLIFDLTIDPKAGSVPGTKDPNKFAAPSATSSRFGLMA